MAGGSRAQVFEMAREAAVDRVRRADTKAALTRTLDLAVAALIGPEDLGAERRHELALALTEMRLAVEETF